MDKYLQAVEKANQNPNFWMSKEYIQKAGLIWIEENGLSGYKINPKDNEWFFPPIDMNTEQFNLKKNIFCGFVLSDSDCIEGSFLDFQFFYNPLAFLSMEGSHWDVFRKNIRKIPRRLKGELVYRPIEEKDASKVTHLLIKWSDRIGKVQDHIVCTKYVLNGFNRWGIFLNDILLGLNVWDENFKYINFRYCIDDGTPFLQEYIRYLFYLHSISIAKKWVNDGGALDNPGLRRFKEKLNPVTIGKVCQYKERA